MVLFLFLITNYFFIVNSTPGSTWTVPFIIFIMNSTPDPMNSTPAPRGAATHELAPGALV